ncbi:roadblock/LC7 domain-containing protein [Anaerolineales bacterium HSG24]|nr:roadblock/LC7 domain-containing protein [Anaerolineales bacterium HSG24]
MTNSKKNNSQLLQDVLDELLLHNPLIVNAIVVSDEGLNVGSGLHHDDDAVIALTASDLVDAVSDFSERLEQGMLNRIVLEGERRTTMIVRAGIHTILAVSVPADVKLGLVILSVR